MRLRSPRTSLKSRSTHCFEGGHFMKERIAKDRPPKTKAAQISRRDGLMLTAASAMASLLPSYAAAAAQTESPARGEDSMTDKAAIRPFRVKFPKADLTDLRRRVAATRWPERETVKD